MDNSRLCPRNWSPDNVGRRSRQVELSHWFRPSQQIPVLPDFPEGRNEREDLLGEMVLKIQKNWNNLIIVSLLIPILAWCNSFNKIRRFRDSITDHRQHILLRFYFNLSLLCNKRYSLQNWPISKNILAHLICTMVLGTIRTYRTISMQINE